MQYQINEFVFDDESLMLFKHGEAIHFRTNEAKLLAFFLQNTDKVVSKGTILDTVWSGKVVSEQVVFQNISHLRSLFGDTAIKTYSKKGYQWLLAHEASTGNSISPAQHQVAQTASLQDIKQKTQKKHFLFNYPANAILVCFLLCATFISFTLLRGDDTTTVKLPSRSAVSVLPLLIEPETENAEVIRQDAISKILQPLLTQNVYALVDNGKHHEYRDVFLQPKKYYDQLTSAQNGDYLLALLLGQRQNNYFVRYIIVGSQSHWIGELEAIGLQPLLAQLQPHIQSIIDFNVLEINVDDSAKRNASLTRLYESRPNDLIVLSRIIRHHSENGAPNKALLLAQELVSKAIDKNNESLEGIAYLERALAFTQLSQLEKAETHLQKAEIIFSRHKNYRSLVAVAHAYIGIAFADNFNYEKIKAATFKAISNSRLAGDYVQEFKDTLQLSHIAGNLGQKDDHVFYLQQAKYLLELHEMPEEYYANYYLYAGIHEKSEQLAEQYLQRSLTLIPEHSTGQKRDMVIDELSKLLVSQARWQEAIALFDAVAFKTSRHELNLASIFAAKQDSLKAEERALTAFKVSTLNSQYDVALDSALFLAEFYAQQNRLDDERFYLEFIKKEYKSEAFWGSYNAQRLKQLGLELDIAPISDIPSSG